MWLDKKASSHLSNFFLMLTCSSFRQLTIISCQKLKITSLAVSISVYMLSEAINFYTAYSHLGLCVLSVDWNLEVVCISEVEIVAVSVIGGLIHCKNWLLNADSQSGKWLLKVELKTEWVFLAQYKTECKRSKTSEMIRVKLKADHFRKLNSDNQSKN